MRKEIRWKEVLVKEGSCLLVTKYFEVYWAFYGQTFLSVGQSIYNANSEKIR